MAVSASIAIEQVSQNIANNTSTIRVIGTATTTGSSHNLNTLTGTVTIDGASQSFTCSLPYTSTTTLFSITKTITHNADGTRSVGASFSLDTRISAGVVTRSATKTLATIPRATTPSLSPSTVTMGEDIAIALPRASSAFTHTLQHDFQAGAWTTFATGAAASAALAVPEEWAERLPNAVQGTGKIRCLTYNGGALIGEKTVSFTAIVPDGIVPTVDSIAVTEATAGIAEKFGAYIQGKSALKVTSEGSGAQGSTISRYLVEAAGKTYEGAEVTTGVINRAGDVNVTVTVMDSRGRTASRTAIVNLLEYFAPTITKFDAFRCDSDGEEQNGSKNLNCVYAFEIASCNGKNDKSYKIEYKRDVETDWIELASGEMYEGSGNYLVLDLLELEYSYNARLVVADYFTSAAYELKVGTEIVPLCVYPTGKGLGIGGYPTKEALQVFFPAEFQSSLKITGAEGEENLDVYEELLTLLRLMREQQDVTTLLNQNGITDQGISPDGVWCYRKWANGFAECWINGVYELSNVSVTVASGWASGYESAYISLPNFPFAFSEIPSVTINTVAMDDGYYGDYMMIHQGAAYGTQSAAILKTAPPKFKYWRGSSKTFGHPKVTCYAIGKVEITEVGNDIEEV